jgi:hypothetical protein
VSSSNLIDSLKTSSFLFLFLTLKIQGAAL